eukprot:9689906-Alexandrium_andersonii.AAC.1
MAPRMAPWTAPCVAPCIAPCMAPCLAPCVAPCMAPCMAPMVWSRVAQRPQRSFSHFARCSSPLFVDSSPPLDRGRGLAKALQRSCRALASCDQLRPTCRR